MILYPLLSISLRAFAGVFRISHLDNALLIGVVAFAALFTAAETRGQASLSASWEPPQADVNLSVEGTADWAHWGLNTAADFNHKSGVAQQISNYTVLGAGSVGFYADNPNLFSWSAGTPNGSATNTANGIYITGLNNGFQMTAPADTASRVLKMYVGVWSAGGKFEASLSDGSAPAYIDTSLMNSNTSLNAVYTINYQATSAGQTLTIEWTVDTIFNQWSNVTLQAATLNTVPDTPTSTATATPTNTSTTTPTKTATRTPTSTLTNTPPRTPTSTPTSALTNTPTNTPAPPAQGSLSAGRAAVPVNVNLSTEGTADWAHWGLSALGDFNHKSGVAQQISNYTPLGSGSFGRYANNSNSYSWSGGTPNGSATNTVAGVYVTGINKGFQLSAPADTTTRTLKMYVGLWSAAGRFEASLSDGSAPVYVDTSLSNSSSTSNAVYTVNYRAASAGKMLTVKWTVNTSFSQWGNVTLQGATLVANASATPTATNTLTASATNTAIATSTSTATATATNTPTRTPTNTPTSAAASTSTGTPTRTATSTPTRTATSTPVWTATSTATSTPTFTPTGAPTPPTSFVCDYHSSPTGSSGGNGSSSNPWDLQTGLNKTGLIVAGKTLCVQGGTYRGKFKSILNGGTVRAFDGAVIDGYVWTTLAADINSTQNTITVADASEIKKNYDAGTTNGVVIDGEVMFILSISGNNITVIRAAAGTSPPSAPVATTHANGARVRLTGSQLTVTGNNTTYRNLEITNSDSLRNWQLHGEEGIRGAGIFNTGSGNKFINIVAHDNLNGLFSGSSSSNTEFYGCISYNNGMYDPLGDPQGKGHGGYFENGSGYSKLHDNLFLNNFNNGIQVYGRSAAYVGGDLRGNVAANSGSTLQQTAFQRNRNLIVGTETQTIPSITMDSNYFFQPHNVNGSNCTFGYGAGVAAGTVTNNYFVGGGGVGLGLEQTINVTATGNKFYSTSGVHVQSREMPYTVNNNTYHATAATAYKFNDATDVENYTFSQWRTQTGFDLGSTIVTTPLPDTAIVRPNAYTPGRAHIVVYVPSGAASIGVNLSTAGLANGQPYTIRNAFNYNGAAVLTGTYNSASATITLPLTGASATVATPFGATYTPPTTVPQFAVFVVVPG